MGADGRLAVIDEGFQFAFHEVAFGPSGGGERGSDGVVFDVDQAEHPAVAIVSRFDCCEFDGG